jgi:NAD-dependent SIR2 family protein deacetylase
MTTREQERNRNHLEEFEKATPKRIIVRTYRELKSVDILFRIGTVTKVIKKRNLKRWG